MMALLMATAIGVAAGPRITAVSGRLTALLTRSDDGDAAGLAEAIARLESELETLAARRHHLEGRDTIPVSHGALLETLAGIGTRHGLRLMRLEPRLEAAADVPARLVVEAGYRGSFHLILRFLGDLEVHRPWLRCRRLAIIRSDGDPAGLQLRIELSLPVVSDE